MTDNVPDYKPVSCDLHSRYELAALRRIVLEMEWQDEGGQRRARVRALDVQTRNGAEYLLVDRPDEQPRWIRLDRIVHCSFPG